MKICSVSRRLLKALKSKKVRLVVDFAIVTLIGLAIFRNFLFSGYWPAGGDILGWISREYLFGHDLRWTYTWRPHSFGFPENVYIIDLFYMVLHFLLNNPVFLIKLVMFLSFIFAGFSAYIFAFRYTRNNLASLSAALVYTLNQWVASQLTEAHVDILISYAAFPIIFLVFERAIESGKFKHSLLLSLCLAFMITGFHPECVVIYGTALALFTLIYIIYPSESKPFRLRLKFAAKVLSVTFLTSFFLASFFTLPFVLNVNAPYFSPSYYYFIEETYNLSYKNIVDAFSLRAIENWGYVNVIGNVYYGLALQNFPIYPILCFIFILAMIITILFMRNSRTIFFTVAALVSIIIAMGPYSFFWSIFIWGWNNIPHFAVFRAIDRWIIIAALSSTYFTSMLVSILMMHLKQKKCKKDKNSLNSRKKLLKRRIKSNRYGFSMITNSTGNFRKVIRLSCVFLITMIFLSGFISCTFLFSQGLQVYALPKSYLEQYHWVAKDPEDFKVVTVNSPETWIPHSQSDFAFSGMLIDVGWWHDLGHDSSFLHDKPTLQNGGWDFSCRRFVDYLRFHVARDRLTDKMTKILGLFGYKYIIMPHYAKGRERSFFLNQKGIEVVYNDSSSLILKNNYYLPRFFAARNHLTVVGGLKSFLSLMKISNFSFDDNALIFADKCNKLHENSKLLIFADGSVTDLIMLSMQDSFIKASDYGFKSWNASKYWVSLPSWSTVGRFVYSGNILTTCGKNLVKIPFYIEKDGEYYIWLRLGFAPNRGKLTITVDDSFYTEIKPQTKFWLELKWINLTCLNLEKGTHIITLKNDGNGYNDIDTIAIIEASSFHEQKKSILETIRNGKFSILYLLEAEINFLENPYSIWNVEYFPYNDHLIYPVEDGENIAHLGNVSASSESNAHIARNAVDGDLTTRWASLKGLPQWIQIEWEKKQKIRGVKINFEWAYAREYAIQVWDGTAWINWLTVKENSEYKRIHVFPQAVETDKIRILFTNAPACNMVSIWELEVYSEQIVTEKTKIYIAREGNYQFFARVFKGPQYGVLHLAVDDKILNASCYSENSRFEWLNLGSLYLGEGEHEIGIGATGDVELDLIAIASTRDRKQLDSLGELFQGRPEKPVVNFEKINPCLYKVHVEAEEPFILVFSDSYHPLWRAILDDGTEIKPVNLYHIVNGFFINRTGKFDLTVRFIGQDYVDLGFKVSLATFIVVLVLLAIPERTYLKIRRKLVDLKGKIIRRRS